MHRPFRHRDGRPRTRPSRVRLGLPLLLLSVAWLVLVGPKIRSNTTTAAPLNLHCAQSFLPSLPARSTAPSSASSPSSWADVSGHLNSLSAHTSPSAQLPGCFSATQSSAGTKHCCDRSLGGRNRLWRPAPNLGGLA